MSKQDRMEAVRKLGGGKAAPNVKKLAEVLLSYRNYVLLTIQNCPAKYMHLLMDNEFMRHVDILDPDTPIAARSVEEAKAAYRFCLERLGGAQA